MGTYNLNKLISNSDLFCGLPEDLIAKIAGYCKERKLRKNETLFVEGTKGYVMYLLVEGCIQLSKTSEKGDSVVIRTVLPSEVFAEVMLFESNLFPVTAVALKPSTVLQLSKFDLSGLMSNEGMRNKFIANLIGRIRYLTQKLLEQSSTSAEDRLMVFLKKQGRSTSLVQMKKKDIAAEIGAKPETLSRLLFKLRKRRAISVKEGKISVIGV